MATMFVRSCAIKGRAVAVVKQSSKRSAAIADALCSSRLCRAERSHHLADIIAIDQSLAVILKYRTTATKTTRTARNAHF